MEHTAHKAELRKKWETEKSITGKQGQESHRKGELFQLSQAQLTQLGNQNKLIEKSPHAKKYHLAFAVIIGHEV